MLYTLARLKPYTVWSSNSKEVNDKDYNALKAVKVAIRFCVFSYITSSIAAYTVPFPCKF